MNYVITFPEIVIEEVIPMITEETIIIEFEI